MTIGRRDFLLGSGGAAVGVLGHRYLVGEPEGTANVIPAPVNELGLMSFAQSGEDIIVGFLLDYLGVQDVSYLDIGAYDPILINNTYYFYKKGHRGVLVEPNVTMCEKLESIRPEDTTLAVGIGVDAVTDAEYYVMSEPSWSTFSRAEAEHQEQITNGEVSIKEVSNATAPEHQQCDGRALRWRTHLPVHRRRGLAYRDPQVRRLRPVSSESDLYRDSCVGS